MNTYETLSRSVCTALAAALLLALLPSVALADVTVSGSPTIGVGYGGAPPTTLQVGQTLTCNCNTFAVMFTDPSRDGSFVQTSVNWYHQGSTASLANAQSYTPQPSDIGSQLVCTVTGKEVGGAGSTAESAPSAPTPSVMPVATVTLRQYSSNVSGNAGESIAGIGVTLTLMRGTSAGSTISQTPVWACSGWVLARPTAFRHRRAPSISSVDGLSAATSTPAILPWLTMGARRSRSQCSKRAPVRTGMSEPTRGPTSFRPCRPEM